VLHGDTRPVRYRTGFDNHSGIDYSVEVGSPIVAPAPGIVYSIPELGPQGQIMAQMHHDSIDFWTGYNHLSGVTVASGQRVSRGQKIAESGKSGTDFPHLHFNTKQLDDDWTRQLESLRILDFYKPTFPVDDESSGYWNWRADTQDIVWKRCPIAKNPGLLGYWTKENDPQFPATSL
jgi:hypothetical protein